MPRSPVSACVIVRDDPLLEGCLKSLRDHVAEIVVVDTGSIDPTCIEIGKRYADRWDRFVACNGPPGPLGEEGKIADFSQARQHAFALASQRWVMWADSDDEVRGAEHLAAVCEQGERHRTPTNVVLVPFRYEYSYDEAGRCNCVHYRERLFSWNPGSPPLIGWRQPIHEVCMPTDGTPTVALPASDQIVWSHRRQYSPKPFTDTGRNLRILRAHVAKVGESDARLTYYLGLECMHSGLHEEALKYFDDYVRRSGWDDEKCIACLKAAQIHIDLLNRPEDLAGESLRKAIDWAYRAVEAREDWGECYFALARAHYFLAEKGPPAGDPMRHFQKCARFATLGLAMPPTRTMLFINPHERAFEIHRYLNIALTRLNDYPAALESADAALAVDPGDRNLHYNRLLLREYMAKEKALTGLTELRAVGNELRGGGSFGYMRHGGMTDEVAAVAERAIRTPEHFMTTIGPPAPPAPEPSGNPGSHPAVQTSGLRIAFALGDGFEKWDPDTIVERGMGGSETAAWQMARRLQKRGHQVRVYASTHEPPTRHKVFEGVSYRASERLETDEEPTDILVASRYAHLLTQNWTQGRSRVAELARKRILWVHDVFAAVWPNAGADALMKADRVLTLSAWHHDYAIQHHQTNGHAVDPSRFVQTRNGVDLDLFDREIERRKEKGLTRDPHKVVYSSSPDRGLESLIQMWPRIRAAVPSATLHVFYGFDNWKEAARRSNNEADKQRIARIEHDLSELGEYGVFNHGRVSPTLLARQFLSASAWLYPTWFFETSCITAMEAQVCGLDIVTTPIGALPETIAKDHGVFVEGDWLTASYQKRFIEQAVLALGKPAEDSWRDEVSARARQRFDWEGVANQWEGMFTELLGGAPPRQEADEPAYRSLI